MMKVVELLPPLEEITAEIFLSPLPVDSIIEIFSRLPVDSIIECKLVCKTWRTLINNDFRFFFAYNTSTAQHCRLSSSNSAEAQSFGFFTLLENQQLRYGESYKVEEETHFKLTKPLNYPPLPRHPCYHKTKPPLPRHPYHKEKNLITSWAILGSSNGLICLSACRFDDCERNSFTYNIYVYNPTTREFVEVRTETYMGDDGFRASGFGYHPSTNKYKVVRINYKTYSSSLGHVSVYTLGSGGASGSGSGWRDIGKIPYVISGVRKPGVLVNGALYWITLDKKILSFDLADEEFRIVSKPGQINEYNCTRLGVLRGCLSAATCAADDQRCTDVWIMNKLYMSKTNSNRTTDDDDDEPSWTRLPRIESSKRPNSDIIDHSDFNEISSYGLKYECFGRFMKFYSNRGLQLHLNLHHLVPYTKSFVSLKALGEENVKKIC